MAGLRYASAVAQSNFFSDPFCQPAKRRSDMFDTSASHTYYKNQYVAASVEGFVIR